MSAQSNNILQKVAQLAKELGANVTLVDGGFIGKYMDSPAEPATKPVTESTPSEQETPAEVPVPQPTPEVLPNHYQPNFYQPNGTNAMMMQPQMMQQNPMLLQQMMQQMIQQNPMLMQQMMMMQLLSQQYSPLVQPHLVQPHLVQQQYVNTGVAQPQVDHTEGYQAQPTKSKKEKSPRVLDSYSVTVIEQAAEQAAEKSRWADVASTVGSQSKPQAPKMLQPAPVEKNARGRGNSRKGRVDKSSIASVQIPEGYKAAPGKVTGANMQRNNPTDPDIPVCTLLHTPEECTHIPGEQNFGFPHWKQCRDVHGNLIPGATTPLANKGAHGNACGDGLVLTSDFCTNRVKGQPACDIHGCPDPTCTFNHVGLHADLETLKEYRIQMRSQNKERKGNSSRSTSRRDQKPPRDQKPRSRAVNDKDDHPAGPTLGDFIAVRNDSVEGLQVDEDATDDLSMSNGALHNAPEQRSVSPQPTIMKKSIDGVPKKIAKNTAKTTQ
jgi:hypothetical protein